MNAKQRIDERRILSHFTSLTIFFSLVAFAASFNMIHFHFSTLFCLLSIFHSLLFTHFLFHFFYFFWIFLVTLHQLFANSSIHLYVLMLQSRLQSRKIQRFFLSLVCLIFAFMCALCIQVCSAH